MIAAVADTHTALWYLFGDARLSATAKGSIDNAASRMENIGVSAISLAEIVYLVEKGRLPQPAYDELAQALSDPQHDFTEIGFTGSIVESLRNLSRSEVPDMPDRMIAATAAYFNVPVISRDRRIRAANLTTLW